MRRNWGSGRKGYALKENLGLTASLIISRLRALNVSQLRALDKTLIIQDNDEPLAVLLKYEHFLAMQDRLGDE